MKARAGRGRASREPARPSSGRLRERARRGRPSAGRADGAGRGGASRSKWGRGAGRASFAPGLICAAAGDLRAGGAARMARTLNCIVAVSQNMGIGKAGDLPWPPLRYLPRRAAVRAALCRGPCRAAPARLAAGGGGRTWDPAARSRAGLQSAPEAGRREGGLSPACPGAPAPQSPSAPGRDWSPREGRRVTPRSRPAGRSSPTSRG